MGLSALKPTLVPLWAAWQLLGGHWRAVGTAVATGIVFVALAAIVVSPKALIDYPAYLFGIAGGDALGVHPAEMVNWRGAGVRLGVESWFVIAGSIGTLGLVALAWRWTSSRHLSAAAAFLATPLVLPHANQHEFVLATVGILLAVAAVPQHRTRLAAAAIAVHAILWSGVVIDSQAAAWLLFTAELGWLLVVVWLARTAAPSSGSRTPSHAPMQVT
jgi:hypothetical protein